MSKARPPAKRKPANTYKRPEPIPPGEILKDVGKKSWRLGPSIGSGGFGDIYSAAEVTESTAKKTAQFPFVVKIEPHDNGPLFVEMHFYMRVCRDEDIATWKTQHKLSALAIPRLMGWGSHDVRQIKHRFLVIERFGTDVWTLFLQNDRKMPPLTVARIADQVLSALEYIHSKGYVHADVKGANLLMDSKDAGRVVLVDFGMANLASAKPDVKRAHNGTAEYASRDAHTGAMTLRGDLETLCLNAVQWLSGHLPWETRLTDLSALHAEKQKHLAGSATSLVSACFPAKSASAPGWLVDWLRQLTALDASAPPNYSSLQRSVRGTVGFTERGSLEFSTPTAVKKPSAAKSRRNGSEAKNDDEVPPKRGRSTRSADVPLNGRTNGRSRKPASDSSDSSEDSIVQDSPPAVTKPKRVVKRKATPAAATPSWRDGAAVSASNVSRPGEYQRKAK